MISGRGISLETLQDVVLRIKENDSRGYFLIFMFCLLHH